ncbi:MAG TPA: type II CAAX endopeptidase family protein [Candidatus Saccharimonadales bacterium]
MSANSSKKTTGKQHARHVGQVVAVTLWVIASFFLAAVVTIGALFVLGKLGFSLDSFDQAVQTTVTAGVMYLIAFVITVGVPKIILKHQTSLKEIGLDRLPSWLDILVGPLGFIPYIILSVLLAYIATLLIPGFDIEEAQDVGFNTVTNQVGVMLAFVTLVVIAPIAEEAMFRGYLYSKLRRLTGVIWATLLTSLVFGLVHLQLNVAVDVFALSLVMCALREVTGSIWAGVLLHMTKNGLAFFLLFVYPML